MDQSKATSRRINIGPIRHPGYGRACRAEQPDSDRRFARSCELTAVADEVQSIKRHCNGPGTYGHISEHDMQRLAEPRAIQEIPNLLCRRVASAVQSFVEYLL